MGNLSYNLEFLSSRNISDLYNLVLVHTKTDFLGKLHWFFIINSAHICDLKDGKEKSDQRKHLEQLINGAVCAGGWVGHAHSPYLLQQTFN